MTVHLEPSSDSFPINVLPACDNLTDFVGHSRGLDLALDARPWRNISEFDHLIHSGTLNNITCLEHAPQLNSGTFFKVIVLAVMAVLSFVANVATIYSITRNHRRQHTWSAVYMLILHLAVADLLVTVFCIGGEAVWSYTVAWIWGNVACKLFKFLQVFSLYLSTFVLILIGVDRFFAVKYPMKGLNTSDRCWKLVIVAWIVSFVFAAPQIVIFHVAQGPFIEIFTQCVTHGFYTEPWQEQLYVSLSLFFMFLLPLAILITTYVSTVITISQSERMFKLELTSNNTSHMNGDINRRKLMHRAKTKSLRISVVIVAAFVLWWTPYYTMMIIFMFLNPDKHLSEELQSAIFFFGMSNSLVNPLIYGAFHLWPRRKRQRELSTTQRRLTPTSNGSNYRRESRETRIPFLSKNNSNTSI
ncbi:Gonadotropin-releasing hormone receptor [Habropoda laboriosa]|uniref:Gonadotropin-releasing hormone receptor n=2 Tax=Habropoda laboriosa TaxID=597456 RepID=A0A0L7RJV1_9HYME|nr:Gonadotropin-releasing hormone receptor [Habropoda laboriosa]